MQIFLIFNQNITIFSQCSAAAGMRLADYFSQCPILFIYLICRYPCVLTEDFEPKWLIMCMGSDCLLFASSFKIIKHIMLQVSADCKGEKQHLHSSTTRAIWNRCINQFRFLRGCIVLWLWILWLLFSTPFTSVRRQSNFGVADVVTNGDAAY